MLTLLRNILSAAPLLAFPAVAAELDLQTGITGVGPAKFLFTLAAAVFLTLLFRRSANLLARIVSAKLGKRRIESALRKNDVEVLHDFILPGAYGGLAKVDYAVLTNGGLLCIQAKHFNGIIFGAQDEPQWSNIDSVDRRRFLNPLIQNEGRCRALRKLIVDVPVNNLVVFTGSIDFTTPPPPNVIRVDQLADLVRQYETGPSKIDDRNAVWTSVQSAAMTDEDTRKDFQAQLGFG